MNYAPSLKVRAAAELERRRRKKEAKSTESVINTSLAHLAAKEQADARRNLLVSFAPTSAAGKFTHAAEIALPELVQLHSDNFPAGKHRRKDSRSPLSLLSWTAINRSELRPNVQLSLQDHLYLVQIYNDNSQIIVVKKSGQAGLSELFVSMALFACDERKLDVLYVMPTNEDVSDFSRMRFGPAIEASPYLSHLIEQAQRRMTGKYRGVDKVSLKRVGDNWLVFRGGVVSADGKARQLKSVPADIVFFDEVDEMNPQAISIALKRLGHSGIKEERYISTPSYPSVGIDTLWKISDKKEWFVPCPHCGRRQQLLYENLVIEVDDFDRPIAWHEKDGVPFIACVYCGKAMDRLAAGEWIAERPASAISGYHPTKLFSAQNTLKSIIDNQDTLDESKKREAINQDLGQAYSPRGGNLSDDLLDECRRKYSFGVVKNKKTFAGIDVGPNMKHVAIRIGGSSGKYRLIYAGEISTFDEVVYVLKKFNVGTGVIDALPETTKARELQAQMRRGKIWLAYYNLSPIGTKYIDPIQWVKSDGVVNLDRTRVMDGMYARFYTQENLLPENARNIKNYYAQLAAPVRITEKDSRGISVARYVETSPDHYAHAETYCYVASHKKAWLIS